MLEVASSGIASLLLPSGRTTHSRFKLPLELTDESICKITKNTHDGSLLAQTYVIIWDESPMNDRRCFETLDRTLRNILDTPEKIFGGKTIILGPVKRKTNWHVNLPHGFLTLAMATLENRNLEDNESSSWVRIPEEYCIPDDNDGLPNLINFIYDTNTLQHPSAQELQQKAIVCPRNDTVDIINSQILSMVDSESTIYKSSNEAVPLGNDRGAAKLLYPMEYLNTLQPSGFPAHELELKLGVPIMLLRNVIYKAECAMVQG
ncbi:DNA helicase [Tanacetum coccineum]